MNSETEKQKQQEAEGEEEEIEELIKKVSRLSEEKMIKEGLVDEIAMEIDALIDRIADRFEEIGPLFVTDPSYSDEYTKSYAIMSPSLVIDVSGKNRPEVELWDSGPSYHHSFEKYVKGEMERISKQEFVSTFDEKVEEMKDMIESIND